MAMTYKQKANMVMQLNKRMRDIINKSGFNTAEFTYWQNRISGGVYKSLETTQAYTKDDQEYLLLSRKKSDIEKYFDEELQELLGRTRTWSEIKKAAMQSMTEQDVEAGRSDAFTGEKRYTNAEVNEFLQMRKTINEWFEENADLVYELIEKTGWADIHSRSNEEIYQKLKEIRETGAVKTYDEQDRDKIRAEYRARRRKMVARRALRR